jgi:putative restriction endonuclease
LINGGGLPEAQAAHIRPVAHAGPDTIRNGIALSGTVHWMFERGLISIDDDLTILSARRLLSEDAKRLINQSGKLITPRQQHQRPSPQFLRFHREQVFKGN